MPGTQLGQRQWQISVTALPDDDEYSKADICTLHAVCNVCRQLFSTSTLIQACGAMQSSTLTHSAPDKFTLCGSLEELEESMQKRCHFCTMVWEAINVRSLGTHHCTEKGTSSLGIKEITLILENAGIRGIQIDISYQHPDDLRPHRARPIFINDSTKSGAYYEKVLHPAHQYFSTSSFEHAKLAQYWFNECSFKHQTCMVTGPALPPTRLLEIQTTNDGFVKIVNCADLPGDTPYCSLSHSWGRAKDILTLSSKNLDELTADFDISRLPKTFRDAITVTRWLGHRHLWIDCLCIIQDSESDWATESAKMSSVYQYSRCTIAAMTGQTPHHGCFERRDPLKMSDCRIAIHEKRSLYAHVFVKEAGDAHAMDQEFLNSRAWVLQERAFSARILCFTKNGIFWGCRAGHATEVDRDGCGDEPTSQVIFSPDVSSVRHISRRNPIKDAQLENLLDQPILDERKLEETRNLQNFSSSWYKIVRAYSKRNLTVAADKLVAISSIALRIQERFGFSYAAGLWKETLYQELLWLVSDHGSSDRPLAYRVPSWSWASVDGTISWCGSDGVHKYIKQLAEIVDIKIQPHPENKNGTGMVQAGTLTLLGRLKQLREVIDIGNALELPLDNKRRLDLTLPNLQPEYAKHHGPQPDILCEMTFDFSVSSEQIDNLYLLALKILANQHNPGDYHSQWIQGLILVESDETRVYVRAGFFQMRYQTTRVPDIVCFRDCANTKIDIK